MPKASVLTPSAAPNMPKTPAPKARTSVARPVRSAKQAALNNAVGAAPTGSRKRASSPTPLQADAPKKVKHQKAQIVAGARVATTCGRATRKAPAIIGPGSDSESEDDVNSKPSTARAVSDAEVDSDEDNDNEDNSGEEELEANDDNDDMENLDAEAIGQALASERPCFAGKPQHKDGNNELTAEVLVSKRALERKAEVPEWVKDEESDTSHGPVDTSGATTANSDIDTINVNWPLEAHYVPPQSGSRTISLTAQPHYVRALVRAAIRQCSGDALFIDAYPSPTTINAYFRGMFIDIANEMDLEAFSLRLQTDNILLDHLSHVLSTRLSNLRCGIKKMTSPKVESSYNINGTVSERREKVKTLITSGDYIYPRNHAGLIFRTKPYHHPMIISAIREYFFSAARGSLASKYTDRFTSSIEDAPDSLELPLPMVAMVATATYAAIDDWNSGFLKKSEFNADAYEDIYRGHELFLNNIRSEKPRAYHRLMADLFSEVCNSQGAHSAQTVASNAMSLLDLAAMEE
ncbi:hypothetical protein H0H92_001683 [Tricholoma furcatifolium]|nr:hypothetical protein H0H92_001683 [Tricholoma furcatifolium]